MRVRVVVTPVAALLTLGLLTGCGSDTAAPTTTLVPMGPTNYATQPPVDDTVVDTVVNGLPKDIVYTIQSGDYLSKIATQFGVSIDDIVGYNGWTDGVDHVLIPGQDIKIPPGGTPQPTDTGGAGSADTIVGGLSTEAPGTESTDAPSAGGGTYVVEAGDYLSGIAAKFNTTMDAIVAANGWSDGIDHVIYPGLEIKLPS